MKPPEKGILKNMLRLIPDSATHSSDANTDDNSSGQNTYDDDDYENEAEIRDILGEDEEGDRDDCDNLNRLPESNSFDFVLSPPSFAGHPVYSPFQTRLCEHQRPLLFTSNPQSPPKSRIIRMKNLDELMRQIDKHTIDLSPSPEDPLLGRLSPSNSEDLRSSETEADRYYQQSLAPSVDTDSKVNDTASEELWDGSSRKSGSETSGLCTVTPMSPLELRSLLNFAYGAGYRKSNDTLLDSQFGDTSSQTGASISRAAYDKSSGYGSEHDPERFSIDEAPLSRSNSNSPPNYSAVIRTGPNQIQLVSASQLQQHGFCGDDKQLHQLLEGLPRINAGSFERSPVTVPEKFMALPTCPPGPLPNPRALHDQNTIDNGSAPCIDRSLEEIPQQDDPIASQSKKNSRAIMKGKRPLSLGVINKHSSPNKDKEGSPSCMGGNSSETKRYSALAKTASVDM